MDKFNGKYRIPSARWAAWDYGRNAAYFVTICTANHAHYFGEIAKAEMILTPLGHVAVDFWNEIPAHFPFVVLDAFVVMPNHVHGIIIIDKSVETQDLASLPAGNRFGPQSRNLASIVRGYKIGVTKYARHINAPFIWQERYYNHIIRNPDEHELVWQYIFANPLSWAEDKFYS